MTGDEREPKGAHEHSARVRSFFALPVPDDALDALRRARDALKRRAARSRVTVRFLSDEALHVTLCFLGDVARDWSALVGAVGDLEKAVAGSAVVLTIGAAEVEALPRATEETP